MTLSYETAKKYNQSESNPRWKGNTALYATKHQFLVRNHGNPPRCERCGTEGRKENGGRWNIHWAKKQEKEYTHDRSDYWGLCRSCHGKYDWNETKTQNMIRAARKQKGTHSKTKSLLAKARQRDNKGHFVSSRRTLSKT